MKIIPAQFTPEDFAKPAVQQQILAGHDRASVVGWLCWNDPEGCYSDSDAIIFGQPYLIIERAKEIIRDQLAGVLPKTPADCLITNPPIRENFKPGPLARKRMALARGEIPEAETFTLKRAESKRFHKTTFENNAAKPAGALFAGSKCIAGQTNLFEPDGKGT